jgi:hypothetical protein
MFDPVSGIVAAQMIYLEQRVWRPIQSVMRMVD